MNEFKLDNEPKITSGFTMPEGYFDTVSDKILARLPQQEPKVISINRTKKTWYYAAAAILILMVSIPLYNNYKSNEEDVDTATLENYLAYHANISEEDIVNLLDEKELEKMNLDLKIQDKDIEEALDNNANLEQYILD